MYIHRRRPTTERAPAACTHLFTIVSHPPRSYPLSLLISWRIFRITSSPTPFSERKIDQIESRLGNIESLLRSLAGSNNALTPDRAGQIHSPFSNIAPTAASTVGEESSDAESAYGGDGALTAQTAFASEFIESAVRKTSMHDVNPQMEAALANLSQLVEIQKKRSISHGPRFPLQKPVPAGGLQKLQMPPLGTVMSLLEVVKCIQRPPAQDSLQFHH